MICKICGGHSSKINSFNNPRTFYCCERCGLVFVPEHEWVSPEEEKKRYECHENSFSNAGYVRYLGRIIDKVNETGKSKPRILDFGCGKNAVLTGLLAEKGFECTPYDPLFGIDIDKNGLLYDIIILCEVIEHLRSITGELDLIKSQLENDGVLIIRTRLYSSVQNIGNWWYAQDKTHINFFTGSTLDEVAGIIGRSGIVSADEDIFVIA